MILRRPVRILACLVTIYLHDGVFADPQVQHFILEERGHGGMLPLHNAYPNLVPAAIVPQRPPVPTITHAQIATSAAFAAQKGVVQPKNTIQALPASVQGPPHLVRQVMVKIPPYSSKPGQMQIQQVSTPQKIPAPAQVLASTTASLQVSKSLSHLSLPSLSLPSLPNTSPSLKSLPLPKFLPLPKALSLPKPQPSLVSLSSSHLTILQHASSSLALLPSLHSLPSLPPLPPLSPLQSFHIPSSDLKLSFRPQPKQSPLSPSSLALSNIRVQSIQKIPVQEIDTDKAIGQELKPVDNKGGIDKSNGGKKAHQRVEIINPFSSHTHVPVLQSQVQRKANTHMQKEHSVTTEEDEDGEKTHSSINEQVGDDEIPREDNGEVKHDSLYNINNSDATDISEVIEQEEEVTTQRDTQKTSKRTTAESNTILATIASVNIGRAGAVTQTVSRVSTSPSVDLSTIDTSSQKNQPNQTTITQSATESVIIKSSTNDTLIQQQQQRPQISVGINPTIYVNSTDKAKDNSVSSTASQKYSNQKPIQDVSSDEQDSPPNGMEMKPPTPKIVRGVNIGGFLVPEFWITPSLIYNIPEPKPNDYLQLCNRLGKDITLSLMKRHWETWVTEPEIQRLANAGITHLRVPIGHWEFVETDEGYVRGGLPYFKRLVHWASRYSLRVVPDIHTAPGSQNGFDNSGSIGPINWTSDPQNVERSKRAFQMLLRFIASDPVMLDVVDAIDVLNEPMIDQLDFDQLWEYDTGAHILISKALPKVPPIISIIDRGFKNFNWWRDQWPDDWNADGYTDAWLDAHLYHVFDPSRYNWSLEAHLNAVCHAGQDLLGNSTYFPILVGEWSLALPQAAVKGRESEARRRFAEVQLDSYEKGGAGWFFWCFKTEESPEWSFLDALDRSWIPTPLDARAFPPLC